MKHKFEGILKGFFLSFILLFALQSANAQVRKGYNNKNFYDLLRESIAKEDGTRYSVLKILPVDVDDQRYYDLDQGKQGGLKNSATMKALFAEDPLDPFSLAIRVDKQMLLDGLGSIAGGGGTISTIDLTDLTPLQCEFLAQSITDCMTARQANKIFTLFDFSILSAAQCTAILSCMDFSQLSTQQATDITNAIDFSQLSDAQCQAIAACTLSGDQYNGTILGTDNKHFTSLETLQSSVPLDVGGTTYPPGTSLIDILNAMIADQMLDYHNQAQTMMNGNIQHIVNGILQEKSTAPGGVNKIEWLNSDGSIQMSVDLN